VNLGPPLAGRGSAGAQLGLPVGLATGLARLASGSKAVVPAADPGCPDLDRVRRRASTSELVPSGGLSNRELLLQDSHGAIVPDLSGSVNCARRGSLLYRLDLCGR